MLRKLFSVLTASALIILLALGNIVMVSAQKPNINDKTSSAITETSVYLRSGFYGRNSMTVDGSILVTDGDVRFDASGSNIVNGNITITKKHEYIEENQYSTPKVAGEVIKSNLLHFEYDTKILADFPKIANVVDNFTAGWWPLAEPITEDTYFKSLTVQSTLTIDTSKNDIYMVIDNLEMSNSGKIEVEGNGHLYLFVNGDINLDGSASINGNGNPENASVLVNGALNVSAAATVKGDIYTDSYSLLINNGGTIYGNIISNAKTVEISAGSKIYGTVYAVNADVKLAGAASIYGMLIADSLEISGSSKVSYDKSYADFNILPSMQKYIFTIDKNIPNAGTVYPEEDLFSYGETISITVNANEGYAFDGFENAENAADIPKNGMYKITKNTTLEAIFAEVEPETPVEKEPDYNGILIPDNMPTTENKLGRLTNESAYIYGYTDTTMAPDKPILRCEAAALLHRLMKQNNLLDGFSKPEDSDFSDTTSSDWYYTALEYMTHIGMYNSKGVNSIYPYAEISRGEAAKMFVFALGFDITDELNEFEDIAKGDKYYDYINTLYAYGYMIGDGYGSAMRWNDTITRAEFVTIYNKIIGRDDTYDYTTTIDGKPVKCNFKDISPDDWFYDDIMRATNSFENYKVNPTLRNDRNELDEY